MGKRKKTIEWRPERTVKRTWCSVEMYWYNTPNIDDDPSNSTYNCPTSFKWFKYIDLPQTNTYPTGILKTEF